MLTSRIDVLDKGWVELQDMMGDDLAIVNMKPYYQDELATIYHILADVNEKDHP